MAKWVDDLRETLRLLGPGDDDLVWRCPAPMCGFFSRCEDERRSKDSVARHIKREHAALQMARAEAGRPPYGPWKGLRFLEKSVQK